MKNVFKPLLLSVIICAVFFTSACGPRSNSSTETIRIGIALYQQDDTFISTMVQNIERLALLKERSSGIKINIVIADGRSSQATQNEQIDRFITQNFDVICVNIVDRTAAAVIIDKAKSADVPLVFFNREPVKEDLERWDSVFYVGSQAEEAGILQGEIIVSAWNKNASSIDKNGDGVLQYVILEGERGHQDALLRTEHSIRTITQAEIPNEKLANDTADWYRGQASARTAQWISLYGDAIELIIANNDDMALGAIDAYLKHDIQLPFIVGVDATAPALEALSKGLLNGTVLNDAVGQASAIISLSTSLALDKTPEDIEIIDEKYVWLTYHAITSENIDEFYMQDAFN